MQTRGVAAQLSTILPLRNVRQSIPRTASRHHLDRGWHQFHSFYTTSFHVELVVPRGRSHRSRHKVIGLRWNSNQTPQIEPKSIPPQKATLAIIGAGLGGLSTAYYFIRALSLTKRRNVKVVILEKSDRLGGWVRSIVMPLSDEHGKGKGKMVFETGPRSIRPAGLQGWLTIEMAFELGLADQILTVPKTHPSAKNRYIYWPSKLTLLPNSLGSALLSPLTKTIILKALPGIFLEPFRPKSLQHLEPDGGDESVDAFFTRRFGKHMAENILSAVIHGIYAGDTRKLSMRAVMPGIWEAEREWGSVILSAIFGNFWRRRGWMVKESPYHQSLQADDEKVFQIKRRLRKIGGAGAELVDRMEAASVWGLQGGLETLIESLKDWARQEGVEIRSGLDGDVVSVTRGGDGWIVKTQAEPAVTARNLVTTSPALLPPSLAPLPIPSTSVSVINLAFPSPPPSQPPLLPPGFGYLIPRSVSQEANPHQVLGVIFDSDVMPKVDDTDSTVLTKCSMLLGGSYWLGKESYVGHSSHDELVSKALETLKLHFPSTKWPEPNYSTTNTHLNCIPQCPVGYHKELRALSNKIGSTSADPHAGKIAVVGGGTGAVGVNGAVKAAYDVGTSFGDYIESGEVRKVTSGLDMWR